MSGGLFISAGSAARRSIEFHRAAHSLPARRGPLSTGRPLLSPERSWWKKTIATHCDENRPRPSALCPPVTRPWPRHDRRAAGQSRHARRHRFLADVALSARIPVRPARHRAAARDLVSDPLRPGADDAAAKIRRELHRDLEPRRRTNRRCGPLRAPRPRSLRQRFGRPPDIVVEWGMRYGNPSIASAVDRLTAAGLRPHPRRFPLYPQYSATTTATANDKLVPRADEDARDAGGAQRAALL